MRSSWVKLFHVAPAAFGAVVAWTGVANAQTLPTDSVNPTLQRSEQYYVGPSVINQAQVTSVSEFVDVKPTDWAFLALQSLVERYGCIVGLPTNPPTYQGRRATTRFEFAAGLNACLDRINELIAAAVEPLVTKEDLLVLQKLQEEFAAELSIIRGRVDALEARTALLEQQQFSTVTKLRSEVIFAPYGVADTDVAYNRIENALLSGNRNFTGVTGTGVDTLARGAVRGIAAAPAAVANAIRGQKARTADKPAFGYRVRMNFDTSFTGNDLLRVRLQMGDIANLNAATGTNQSRLGFDAGEAGNVVLNRMFYRFSFDRGRGTIMIAAAGTEHDDFYDAYSPIASSAAGSISRFGRFNPLFYRAGNVAGAGALVGYKFNDIFRVDAGYLAYNPATGGSSAANPDLGLFGSNYTASLLFGVEPLRNFKFGVGGTFVYNENVTRGGGTAAAGINLTGSTGTDFAVNPFNPAGVPGVIAGATRTAVKMQTVNLMFQWRALPQFTLAGWFGYGWVRGESDTPALPSQGTRRANLLTAALQFIFPDVFGRRGDTAAVVVGIPPYVTASEWSGGTLFAAPNRAGTNVPQNAGNVPPSQGPRRLNLRDTSVPVHLEAFYRFQVNKFIQVTPGAFVVFNPNGQDTNDPVVVYTIRTTFTF
jgi:hypothetical protein